MFGLVLLVLIVGAFIAPPLYAAFAFYTGDWLFGSAGLLNWVAVLCCRRPVLRWTMQGIESAGI
jgi:hypothetical protein